jgi:hypothetical protein
MNPVQPQFVGMDAGNSTTKWATFDKEGKIIYGSIPNVAGPAIDLDFPPTGPSQDVMCVTIENEITKVKQKMFLGNLALNQLQDVARQDRSRDKANSDNINLFVPAVLGLLDDGRPIVMSVGCTLTDYSDQAPEIVEKLTGNNFKVKFHYGSKAGKEVDLLVAKTYTYAQCAAGLIGMLKTDRDSARWLEKTVLGIDFGQGQINVAVMQDLMLIKQSCFSVDYGFYRVVSAVDDFLSRKPHYVTATIPQLQSAVENGRYVKNNVPIDLSGTIHSACQTIADQIHSKIISKLPPSLYDSINTIVLMGGGAKAMEPTIKAKFGLPIEIADDAMYANARGLLLVAREKWGKENA